MKFKDWLNEGMKPIPYSRTNETLSSWNNLILHDQIQSIYVWEYNSNYDGLVRYYFHPRKLQKNGRMDGVMFVSRNGKTTGKASKDSVSSMDFNKYKKVDERKMDKKIFDKIGKKLSTLK